MWKLAEGIMHLPRQDNDTDRLRTCLACLYVQPVALNAVLEADKFTPVLLIFPLLSLQTRTALLCGIYAL